MSDGKKHVVIIGGGITGLAAAFYMEKEIKEKNLPLELTLVEASPRVGGKSRLSRKTAISSKEGQTHFWNERKAPRSLLKT